MLFRPTPTYSAARKHFNAQLPESEACSRLPKGNSRKSKLRSSLKQQDQTQWCFLKHLQSSEHKHAHTPTSNTTADTGLTHPSVSNQQLLPQTPMMSPHSKKPEFQSPQQTHQRLRGKQVSASDGVYIQFLLLLLLVFSGCILSPG